MALLDTLASLIYGYQDQLKLLGLASVVMLIGSAIVIPLLVIQLPPDYFADDRNPATRSHHPVLRAVLLVVRNTIGLALLVAGIIMLFLPGQGLLTIMMAIVLVDFPGKRALEQRIAARPAILNAANRMRAWFGHAPLRPPAPRSAAPS